MEELIWYTNQLDIYIVKKSIKIIFKVISISDYNYGWSIINNMILLFL